MVYFGCVYVCVCVCACGGGGVLKVCFAVISPMMYINNVDGWQVRVCDIQNTNLEAIMT